MMPRCLPHAGIARMMPLAQRYKIRRREPECWRKEKRRREREAAQMARLRQRDARKTFYTHAMLCLRRRERERRER